MWQGGWATLVAGTVGTHSRDVKTRKLKDAAGLWNPMWGYLCTFRGVRAIPVLLGQ